MDRQSPTALSHGCGQQSSIASETDISEIAVMSVGFSLNAAPLAAGSIATETAMRTANMVRAIATAAEYPAASPNGQVTILRAASLLPEGSTPFSSPLGLDLGARSKG